jgi:hypothetical protein
VGDDLVDEADRGRLLGGERLAREHEPAGQADADAARRSLRPAEARIDADTGLGEREAGARCRDQHVAGLSQLQPAA